MIEDQDLASHEQLPFDRKFFNPAGDKTIIWLRESLEALDIASDGSVASYFGSLPHFAIYSAEWSLLWVCQFGPTETWSAHGETEFRHNIVPGVLLPKMKLIPLTKKEVGDAVVRILVCHPNSIGPTYLAR